MRLSPTLIRLQSSALYEADQYYYYGNYQQNVNKPAQASG